MSRRKEALTQFNKNNILIVAEKLFTEKGILQTTMDEIAKKADYSKATLYAYFKSKDDIYNHLVYKNMVLLKVKIEEYILSSNNLKDCFIDICNGIASYSKENPLFLNSILGRIGISDKEFEEMPILKDIFEVGEEINTNIKSFISKGIGEGLLREDINPMEVSISIWSSLCGVIIVGINKKDYFENRCGLDLNSYLNNSFDLIWRSIAK